MKPEVETKILNIVKMTCEEAKISFNQIKINITGSITSNSYTQNADIDVHLQLINPIREPSDITQNRFSEAFKKVKQHYESEGLEGNQGLFVSGHPIEVYYQPNKFQDLMSVGCYDLTNHKWLVGPEMTDPSFNPYSEYYKEIQMNSEKYAIKIRNMIFSIYEIAVVLKKNIGTEFGKNIREVLVLKLEDVQKLYDELRQMRKVYSSPESEEQALEYRSSRKWKIADASFKLFDKYGYTAILKQFIEDYKLIQTSHEVDIEVVEDILSTVKHYINNADKLAEQELYEAE